MVDGGGNVMHCYNMNYMIWQKTQSPDINQFSRVHNARKCDTCEKQTATNIFKHAVTKFE